MHPAAADLAELPGVVAHISGADSIHRGLDDHTRRAMPRPCRPGIDHAAHVFGKAGHVEAAVLHADIHVVGPGPGIDAALRVGQHMAAVRTVVIDRLIVLQQFDGAIDPLSHEWSPPAVSGEARARSAWRGATVRATRRGRQRATLRGNAEESRFRGALDDVIIIPLVLVPLAYEVRFSPNV